MRSISNKYHLPRPTNGKTALSCATNLVPVVPSSFTIGEARKLIDNNIGNYEVISYVYVVDQEKLVGILTTKALFALPEKTRIKTIAQKTGLVSVLPEDKPDHAAFLAMKHRFHHIPVVDKSKHFYGVITSNEILAILHKKHLEEKFIHAGLHRSSALIDDVFNISIFQSLKHRILWLIIGLFGGLFAAYIIRGFEQTLNQHLILAAFIPLVVYIADAVGTQLEAFAIRDFALTKKLHFGKYFFRQLAVVLLLSLALGIISGIVSLIMYKDFLITLILIAAVVASVISSVITGLFLPYLFRKFKKDPANGSGPVGTILQDLLSIIIYFGVASLLL